MAFRANETAEANLQRIRHGFIRNTFTSDERVAAERGLEWLVENHGPAVRAYPIWHPLVAHRPAHRHPFPITYPGHECGYLGLDHTALFAHAFVTCPYDDGAGLFSSFAQLPEHMRHRLAIERLDFPFYDRMTTPILVYWDHAYDFDGHHVPKHLAIPMMLQELLPLANQRGTVAETWETMRPYLLGDPHGGRSSPFVDQDTGLAIKRMHEQLNASGMFGTAL